MRRVLPFIVLLLVFLPGFVRASYVFNAFPDLPSFNSPIGIEDPMDGTDRLFVVQRSGSIYVFDNDATANTRTLFLDISTQLTTAGEGGLLGLAFHPDHETNRYFYVTFTAENPRREVLARFTADAANPDAGLPGSKLVILEVAKASLFHNGGRIAFGADGFLYWSLGEDGSAHAAQDLSQLNGKLLRIDVNNPSGGNQYGIPPGNPFVGVAGRDEIWAFGFRNPWRFSFDPPTGRLWLADVGQDNWEEINIVRKGRNYGWPLMEGNDCYSPPGCDTTGLNLAAPLFAYAHSAGASVTGGFVYRGPSVPSLAGRYIYADFITGEIRALTWNGVSPPTNSLITTHDNIPSFGVDKDGELFIAAFDGGIYRLFTTPTDVPAPSIAPALSVAPNPFEASTTISFALAPGAHASVDVFDVAGRRVSTVVKETAISGPHAAQWDGRDTDGNTAPSGVYFVRLLVNGEPVRTRRVVLVR
jgi:hypothetical protein